MEKLITEIKNNFRSEISSRDPLVLSLRTNENELYHLLNQQNLFNDDKAGKSSHVAKRLALEKVISLQTEKIEDIQANKIFESAFEWRFEFPEVLNDDGSFRGFDVIIGNPPYGVSIKGEERDFLINSLAKVPDHEIYYWFINRAHQLLHENGGLSYIIPNALLFNVYAKSYRLDMLKLWTLDEVLDCTNFNIFSEATVRNIIMRLTKGLVSEYVGFRNTQAAESFQDLVDKPIDLLEKSVLEKNNQNWALLFKLPKEIIDLVEKIRQVSTELKNVFPETSQGLIAYDKYQGQSADTIKNRIFHSSNKKSAAYKPWLYGEDVKRYHVAWNNEEYLNYCDGIANPRDPKFFKGMRILVREITNPSIFAALATDEMYNDPSVLIVKDNKSSGLPILCLLGILNSKLAKFYHFNSAPKATKGAFPKILVDDINNFPLPKTGASSLYTKLSALVLLVVEKRASSLKADISKIDQEIDGLIYELYGLSELEISLIESLT